MSRCHTGGRTIRRDRREQRLRSRNEDFGIQLTFGPKDQGYTTRTRRTLESKIKLTLNRDRFSKKGTSDLKTKVGEGPSTLERGYLSGRRTVTEESTQRLWKRWSLREGGIRTTEYHVYVRDGVIRG